MKKLETDREIEILKAKVELIKSRLKSSKDAAEKGAYNQKDDKLTISSLTKQKAELDLKIHKLKGFS